MANALYKKLGQDGTWYNQGNPGGPVKMYITPYQANPNLWTYELQWSDDVRVIVIPATALQTPAQAQTALDTYAAALNAGTA